MILSLVACGNNSAGTDSDQKESVDTRVEDTTVKEESDPSGQDTTDQNAETEGNTPKALVVYFSGSGNTRRAAEFVADEIGADTFELVPVKPYTEDDLDWTEPDSRVNKEHDDATLQDIELASTEIPGWNDYQVVFVGYPIWWQEAAWPINNFIKNNDFSGKKIIPFCTSTSSGLGESGNNLAKMAGSGDWLDGERFSEQADEGEIRDWIRGLVLGILS